DAARPLFERALAINERVLGPDHPGTATGLNDLAVLHYAQGELAAARPLYERALAINERVLGADHPDTAMVRSNLASLVYGNRIDRFNPKRLFAALRQRLRADATDNGR